MNPKLEKYMHRNEKLGLIGFKEEDAEKVFAIMDEDECMNKDLTVKYYYVINQDLQMSKGKIASQVSHVAMMLADKYHTIGKAIIVKAPEQDLRFLIDNKLFEVCYIEDAGLTEVPAGSLTCVGFKIPEFPENVINNFVQHLKLV